MKPKRLIVLMLALVLLIGAVGCTGQVVLGTIETPSPTPQATPKVEDPAGDRASGERLAIGGDDRAWLGLTLETVEDGVRIVAVTPGSPADEAGVRQGDVIMWMDGNRVRHKDDVIEAMGEVQVGEQVTLTLRRDGQELDLKVTAGERPEAGTVSVPGDKSALEDWLSQLPTLKNVESEDLFRHFIEGRFVVVDEGGREVTLTVVAGRLTAVSTDSVTVDLNRSGSGAESFRVLDSTIIWENSRRAAIGNLRIDDKVLVVTADGSQDAVAIVKVTGSGIRLRLPDSSSVPGWDELRERLRDLGVPDVLVPDPDRNYGFVPR